jgi:hypothetical protein
MLDSKGYVTPKDYWNNSQRWTVSCFLGWSSSTIGAPSFVSLMVLFVIIPKFLIALSKSLDYIYTCQYIFFAMMVNQ